MSFQKSPTPKRESQGSKPGSPSRSSQHASANPSQHKETSGRSSPRRSQTGLGIPTPPKDRIGTPS